MNDDCLHVMPEKDVVSLVVESDGSLALELRIVMEERSQHSADGVS